MTNDVNSATVLRNLAKDLLNVEENTEFKSALQTYRTTGSITGLVAQLTKVVTSTEKLMLLVEISCFLAEPRRRDFQKLCCLHFPKYDSFLTYFTPNSVGERNTTIEKDSSGQFQVISTGLNDQFFATNDQRSLQGESGIDVNSDVDDISRHGGDANSGYLGNSWKIESRSQHRDSVSSNASHSAASAPTPKGSVSSGQQVNLNQAWKQSHTSLPTDQGQGNIRNRARSLRQLSGSLPSVLAMRSGSQPPRAEDRARILLKRRGDGSLGLGVKGGKEYNAPIEVFQVEPGSQGEQQGLRVGDWILDVNGTDFTNVTHAEAVKMMRNAWNIIMVVQHRRMDKGDAQSDCLDGRIGSTTSMDDWEVSVYPTKKGKLGCGVYRDRLSYIVVKNVEKNSPASKAGLIKGDRFLEIEDIPVCGLSDKQVATLTNTKRIRIKILRPTASISTRAPSESIDFNTMFSPLTLDLSKLEGNEIGQNRDDDQNTFASSTPRKGQSQPASRSHSEERHVVQAEVHHRPRSASQNPDTSRNSNNSGGSSNSKRPLPPTPSPQQSRPVNPEVQENSKNNNKNKPKRVEVLSRSASANSLDDNVILSSKESGNITPKQQQHQQQQQQRLYRPRVVVPGRQSSGSYSPSIQQKQHFVHQTSINKQQLGRYISHNTHHPHAALPSRMAMVYSSSTTSKPNSSSTPRQHYQHQHHHNINNSQQHHHQHDRSRPKKRIMSSSASGKMKELRHRSQHSPHHHHQQHASNSTTNISQSKRQGGSMPPPQRDREFLRVIQSSVERRQRAHRLSLYQLPDQDDDTWRID